MSNKFSLEISGEKDFNLRLEAVESNKDLVVSIVNSDGLAIAKVRVDRGQVFACLRDLEAYGGADVFHAELNANYDRIKQQIDKIGEAARMVAEARREIASWELIR